MARPLLSLILLFFTLTIVNAEKVSTVKLSSTVIHKLIQHLQKEQSELTAIQQRLIHSLDSKGIFLTSDKSFESTNNLQEESSVKDRLAISTDENPIECRISLDVAPDGAICVAPCGCTGSQKWVQFGVLNKLRRKDPQQWKSCPTCRQPYQYQLFTDNAGLSANLLGLALDNLSTLRTISFATFMVLSYLLSVQSLLKKFLVSRFFWQQVFISFSK